MDLQQKFGQRLLSLLEEQNISQGDFAEIIGCSRQSINFYILGKRSPDIVLASRMSQYLGVSCDYLVGLSDIRTDKQANCTAVQLGISEDTMKFFAGLKMMTSATVNFTDKNSDLLISDYRANAQKTLDLLNEIISHDQFGILIQYVKRYCDICHGKDEISILKNFMFELESPTTGKLYGSQKENDEMMKEFCLHVISKYFDQIIRDISK